MLYAIVGVLVLLVDQFMKFWTVSHVELNTGIHPLLPGIVHLTHIKNFGAAFGLFSNAPWLRWVLLVLLLAFTAFIVLGLVKRYLRTGFARWTGVLLLAGLLGNGIDRAIYGYVVDMLELEFINFAIFNLADMLVVIFGILFCVALLCGGIGQPDEEDFEDEDDYDDLPPRRRVRRDEEEEPIRRRVRRDEEEEPVRRRVRRDEEEEPVRRRVRRDEEEEPVRRRPRPAEEAEPAQRAPRRPYTEAEAAAPRVRRVISEDTVPVPDRSARPAAQTTPRPAAPTAQRSAAPAAQRPTRPVSEPRDATVRTVARPAPAAAPARS